MNTEPNSILTLERPDIWHRSLELATQLTGYKYAPKLPLADGTIFACGSYTPDRTPAEQIKYKETQIKEWQYEIKEMERTKKENWPGRLEKHKEWVKKAIEDVKKLKEQLGLSPSVFVPEGGMEWLIHEVGHWIVATPEEQSLPNYGLTLSETGHDGDRELQAWAFEEIVMAPFGSSRYFASPTQRDGAAFKRAGSLPIQALHYTELRMREHTIAVEQWRTLWGEWVRWGNAKLVGSRPWDSVN